MAAWQFVHHLARASPVVPPDLDTDLGILSKTTVVRRQAESGRQGGHGCSMRLNDRKAQWPITEKKRTTMYLVGVACSVGGGPDGVFRTT